MYIAALVAGGYFFATKNLDAVDFALYFIYIGIFINPIDELINFTELFQRGFSGFRRFAEVVETKPESEDKKDARDITVTGGEIEYRDVVFSYDPGISVLNGVNFTANRGETVALVGPSGGGKTTICSLLPRFYPLASGAISIDGTDIRDFTLKSLRKNVGIVQQDVYIFSGTVKENIGYGKQNASDEEIIAAAKRASVHDFIMTLPGGYDSYVGERGTRLSGGQKQRISIARVFLKNPKILILDEATSSLDNESEKEIQKALSDLSKDRTTVIIAHRLSTIRNADKILVVDKGRIAESGNHKELISKGGIYARYYKMQFEGMEIDIAV
jgi:ABC-type multidrug transport system, ATPase and permease components